MSTTGAVLQPIFEIEDATPTDYNWIEYSDDGITWNRPGRKRRKDTNWFNDPTGKKQWRNSLTTWHVASSDITHQRIKRAIPFCDGERPRHYLHEGVSIDDIPYYRQGAYIYRCAGCEQYKTVSGSNWVHFTSGSTRIASINANGLTWEVQPYTPIPTKRCLPLPEQPVLRGSQYCGSANQYTQAGYVSVFILPTRKPRAAGGKRIAQPVPNPMIRELGVTKFTAEQPSRRMERCPTTSMVRICIYCLPIPDHSPR